MAIKMADLWQYYLLIITISIQGLFCLKQNNRIFLGITFLELLFVSGFRAWHIGNDTFTYVNVFIASTSSIDMSQSYMEKGYLLFNKCLSLFTDNPQAILIVTSFIILGAIFYFIYKYSKFVFLSTLFFVIIQFSITLTMIRQEMALIIVLLGFSFVIKRQFIKFLICCLLATTFHNSAIIAIVWYFIYPLNVKIKNIIAILIVTILIFIFSAPFIDNVFDILGKYQGYVGNRLMGEEIKVASIVNSLICFVVFLFCFISYFFVCAKSEKNDAFIIRPQFLVLSSLIALCIQFISVRGTILERIALYFSFLNIISIPAFVNCYSKNIKIVLEIFIITFFIIYASIVFVYRPEWNYILPFEFCF